MSNIGETLIKMEGEHLFTEVFFPLGFPIHVETNRSEILDMARESWGAFTCAGSFDCLYLELEFFCSSQQSSIHEPVTRVDESFLTIAFDEWSVIVADLNQGRARGRLNEVLLQNRQILRYYVLEAIALSMVSVLRAVALHAACVDWKGKGVLLCGESGAGKTTLAYACARKGWGYVTDDASYLLLGDAERRVIGNCHQMRFRDTASELFTELRDRTITKRAEGKPSIEILTKELRGIRSLKSAKVEFILFLNRRGDLSPSFYPIPQEQVREYFTRFLISNQPDSSSHAAIQYLLDAKIFEFRYSNLNSAIDFLSHSME